MLDTVLSRVEAVTAILADTDIARKGLERYADLAGVPVVPSAAQPALLLQQAGVQGDVDATLCVIVGPDAIHLVRNQPLTPGAVDAALRLLRELLTSWIDDYA